MLASRMATTSNKTNGSGSNGRSGSAGTTVPHTRIEDEKMIEQEYCMGRKLGQGSFGIVREVRHRQSNETWACKLVNKEKAGSSALKLLEREVSILKRVHHEHIIRLKEVFETSKKMYLIMELCEGGELADELKEKGTFSEDETRTIVARLTSAISYLHKDGMVHRDLKLENILLSKNPDDSSDNLYIKVTDFGLSVVKGGVSHENMMMDFCGTPMYMAPEIIENKTYSEKCDVWAIGVIVYTLLCGQPPFVSKDEEKLYDIIKTADISKHFEENEIWQGISKEAKDCVCGMLTVDPAHRYTAHEVQDHPWISGEERPPNVLSLMRQWKDDLDDDRSTVCGEDTTDSLLKLTNGKLETDASPDGMLSAKQTNNNNNHQSPRKVTPRNSLDSQQPSPSGVKGKTSLATSHAQRSKSKSPTDPSPRAPRLTTGVAPAPTRPSRAQNGATRQVPDPKTSRRKPSERR